jgi:hypothetical protein
MLSTAFSRAYQYTRPLIILKRLENRTVIAGVGTFFLLNKAGWALTAAHLISDLQVAQQHQKERADYLQACAAIDADQTLSEGKKKNRKGKLNHNFQWITKIGLWWGANGVRSGLIYSDIEADIALTQLTDIQNLQITEFPKLASVKRPLKPGMTTCRLGFPFFGIKAGYDEAKDDFEVPPIAAIPLFPNEGIHTRIMSFPNSQRKVQFIETSNPGLRGQSGGPIFDQDGVIWAVQSKTISLPLGFEIEYEDNGRRKQAPEQFIHVGIGAHTNYIRELLKSRNVAVDEQD